MDLAIHIILGLCLVVGALCIFLANLLMKELNEVINNLYAEVNDLKTTPKYVSLCLNRDKEKVNVVDEKPLDFPNDRKE